MRCDVQLWGALEQVHAHLEGSRLSSGLNPTQEAQTAALLASHPLMAQLRSEISLMNTRISQASTLGRQQSKEEEYAATVRGLQEEVQSLSGFRSVAQSEINTLV